MDGLVLKHCSLCGRIITSNKSTFCTDCKPTALKMFTGYIIILLIITLFI